jgi:hypothetical protein
MSGVVVHKFNPRGRGRERERGREGERERGREGGGRERRRAGYRDLINRFSSRTVRVVT